MSSFISNKSVTNQVLHNEDDNFLTLIDKMHNHTIHVNYLKVDVGSMVRNYNFIELWHETIQLCDDNTVYILVHLVTIILI